MVSLLKDRYIKYNFLLAELVKRDFKKKYKRTVLGVLWSLLNPLLNLLVMSLVFIHFFGNDTPNFTIYVFSGLLVFNFFSESTNSGMSSLMANAGILTKVKIPKYLFLLSKNVSVVIGFLLTLAVYFLFVAFSDLQFSFNFILLIYPIITLTVFNIGVGLILSALFVFFKDVQYLYDIFTRLVMFMSAIFYPTEHMSPQIQQLFLINPIFAHIHYFRQIVLHGTIPSLQVHLIIGGYALMMFVIGGCIYKHYNHRFIYYM